MLLRTPAAVTPDKQRTAAGSGVFHAQDITGAELSPAEGWGLRQVLAPRLIWRGRRLDCRFSAACWYCAFYFFRSGRCRVLCVSGIAQKGMTAMTDQLAACYEGTEPFLDAGGPPRTVAGAV